MQRVPPTYEDFLKWLKSKQRDEVLGEAASKALSIADGSDNTNRTGHMLRGYLGAAPFLLTHRRLQSQIIDQPFIDVEHPLDLKAIKFVTQWVPYLERNRRRHAILKRILPKTLGGDITTGGGGAYPLKLALRLSAHYLSGEPAASSAEQPRFRMVRKPEFDRDSAIVRDLKRHYGCACQVCGNRIEVKRGTFYCEGHHLRPLGRDHKGKDVPGNIVILCPTHHAEFDFFLFAILGSGSRRALEHMTRKLENQEAQITVSHAIDQENIDYVIEQFLTRLDLHFPKKR